MEFIHMVLNMIMGYINAMGYWGVGVGMMFESACIPIPSELVLPLGGNMVVSNTSTTLLGINIAANVGSMIGSLLAYYVGYYGGRPFILKYGKYFFVSQKHFYSAEKTFQKYGIPCVFFGRLLPIIRTFISLPSGIAKLNVWKFSIYSLIGMIPWNFALIYLGYLLGANYDAVAGPFFKNLHYIVIAGIILAIAVPSVKYFIKKKKNQN